MGGGSLERLRDRPERPRGVGPVAAPQHPDRRVVGQGAAAELVDETGLADTGLTAHDGHARPAAGERLVPGGAEPAQLRFAADEGVVAMGMDRWDGAGQPGRRSRVGGEDRVFQLDQVGAGSEPDLGELAVSVGEGEQRLASPSETHLGGGQQAPTMLSEWLGLDRPPEPFDEFGRRFDIGRGSEHHLVGVGCCDAEPCPEFDGVGGVGEVGEEWFVVVARRQVDLHAGAESIAVANALDEAVGGPIESRDVVVNRLERRCRLCIAPDQLGEPRRRRRGWVHRSECGDDGAFFGSQLYRPGLAGDGDPSAEADLPPVRGRSARIPHDPDRSDGFDRPGSPL